MQHYWPNTMQSNIPELVLWCLNNCFPKSIYLLKNDSRNAKIVRLIKWSIVSIFNEAEPPWSNTFEILGQQMPCHVFKSSKKNYGRESVNGTCLPCRPPARLLRRRHYPIVLKGWGIKTIENVGFYVNHKPTAQILFICCHILIKESVLLHVSSSYTK